jgi:hypothetical protein
MTYLSIKLKIVSHVVFSYRCQAPKTKKNPTVILVNILKITATEVAHVSSSTVVHNLRNIYIT